MSIKAQHKHYQVLISEDNPWHNQYTDGAIASVSIVIDAAAPLHSITIAYRSGEIVSWNSNLFGSYNALQFGIAVSHDGKYLFAQTWEKGLFCLDARNGACIWRTKSRKGITNLFVNENTVACLQHNHALLLLDIHDGTVLKSLHPIKAWGFIALDSSHLICQFSAREWQIIEAETLLVRETIPHKTLTNNHTNASITDIKLADNGSLTVSCSIANPQKNSAISAISAVERLVLQIPSAYFSKT